VQCVASAQTPDVEAEIARFLGAIGITAKYWLEDEFPLVSADDEGNEVVGVIDGSSATNGPRAALGREAQPRLPVLGIGLGITPLDEWPQATG
jgi:hypothetical protein